MDKLKIISAEISHENVPIEVRESMSFLEKDMQAVVHNLNKGVKELFVLSTCNRFSIYSLADSTESVLEYFSRFGDIVKYLEFTSTTEESVEKLLQTACGLRSQVIGEHEIMGQIKKAYQVGQEENSLGSVLDEFVRFAISVGKRARAETNIGRSANSLAGVSLSLIKRKFDESKPVDILLIGTGKMALLFANTTKGINIGNIYVASHDLERAISFAQNFNAIPIDIKEVPQYLHKVNVVIGGTHTEISLIDNDAEHNCMRHAVGQEAVLSEKQLFIDLGLPRNFNPNITENPNIELYNLDDLKLEIDENAEARKIEIPHVNRIVSEEKDNYLKMFQIRKLSPALGAYWQKLEQVKEERLKWLMPKLGDVNQEQLELIEKFAHHMIRDFSKDVFQEIRAETSNQERTKKMNSILELNKIKL